MVKLEELEDEHFLDKPNTTRDEALLADDDDDYSDTDSEISSTSSTAGDLPDETLLDRLTALQDIIPPQTRAKISSVSSSIVNATASGITYGGKGLWIVATSVLLMGLPYALALGDEQQIQEEQASQQMMQEGAQGLINPGEGEAKASL